MCVTCTLAETLPLDCLLDPLSGPVAPVSTGLGRVDILGLVLLVTVCVTDKLTGTLLLKSLFVPLPGVAVALGDKGVVLASVLACLEAGSVVFLSLLSRRCRAGSRGSMNPTISSKNDYLKTVPGTASEVADCHL